MSKLFVKKSAIRNSIEEFDRITINPSFSPDEKFNRLINSVQSNIYLARHVVDVAHKLIKIRSIENLDTLIHVAMHDNVAARNASENKLILRIENAAWFSVAHALAEYRCNEFTVRKMIKDKNIASLSDVNGNSVAHIAACNDNIAMELLRDKPPIVYYENKRGISVLETAEKALRYQHILNEDLDIIRSYNVNVMKIQLIKERLRRVALKEILK